MSSTTIHVQLTDQRTLVYKDIESLSPPQGNFQYWTIFYPKVDNEQIAVFLNSNHIVCVKIQGEAAAEEKPVTKETINDANNVFKFPGVYKDERSE